jgi:hypothetical protein
VTSRDSVRKSWFVWFLAQLGVGLLSGIAVFFAGFGTLAVSKNVMLALTAAFLALIIVTAVCRRQAAGALLLGPALAIVASLPLMTTAGGGRDPVRAEAEQMLGSVKGQVRFVYAKYGETSNIRTLTGPREAGGCEILPSELQGKYYRVRDQVTLTETGAVLYADPMPPVKDKGICTITFNWSGGDGRFTWDP